MPTDSQMLERIHVMERIHSAQVEKILNLEAWVSEIHKTLKSVEMRVTLGMGGFLGIELFFKIWGK